MPATMILRYCVVAFAGILPPASSTAQPGPAVSGAGAPAVCDNLITFLRERPLLGRGDTRVTLEEALRFELEGNRFACRSAIHGLYVAGVPLPPVLRDAIGLPPQ